jgi:hypothetical protein
MSFYQSFELHERMHLSQGQSLTPQDVFFVFLFIDMFFGLSSRLYNVAEW